MFTPTYHITDQMLEWLSEIAQIKAMVDHAILLPAREAHLRRATMIKMTHSSTSIEGNTLEEYQYPTNSNLLRVTSSRSTPA